METTLRACSSRIPTSIFFRPAFIKVRSFMMHNSASTTNHNFFQSLSFNSDLESKLWRHNSAFLHSERSREQCDESPFLTLECLRRSTYGKNESTTHNHLLCMKRPTYYDRNYRIISPVRVERCRSPNL